MHLESSQKYEFILILNIRQKYSSVSNLTSLSEGLVIKQIRQVCLLLTTTDLIYNVQWAALCREST